LQEVEGCSLAGEQRAGRTLERAQLLIGAHPLAIANGPRHANARIDLSKHFVEPCRAAQHGVLARDH
jgi:hypothetical protein